MEKQFDNSSSAWRKRLLAAERHPDGILSYCKEAGISLHRYYVWRRRVRGGGKLVSEPSPFAAVEVVEPKRRIPAGGLPDPRWLAEFLLSLSAGGAR